MLNTATLQASPEAKLQSMRLRKRIVQDIEKRHGWISFEQFMQHALYTPELGYYCSVRPKFGASGDFVTAPLLGDVTAHCLAKQCAEVLTTSGGEVLECGAGDGRLAADMLLALQQLGQLPTRYLILETSAVLRARQQQTLASLSATLRERVFWLKKLPPEGICGVVLANEVLDAMPAMRFEIDAHGKALELGVGVSEQQLHWVKSANHLPEPLHKRLTQQALGHTLPCGYRSEIGVRAEAWVRTLGASLKRGVMLLLDYGFPRREFYHAERQQGTLMCHYQHTAHDDPFFYPGLQDISVHIDFTALAQAAHTAGLTLVGYTSQGAFLLSLGALDKLAESLRCNADNQQQSFAISQQIQTLTMAHEMGELFKVIAFSRNYNQSLSGFSKYDRCGALTN